MTDTPEVHISSGNVFADLGLPDAEELQLKSSIVIQLRRLIQERKLTQTAAAKRIGITQSDLSKVLSGKFQIYAVSRLMTMLTAFEQDVEIVMRPHAKAGETGRISFTAQTA